MRYTVTYLGPRYLLENTVLDVGLKLNKYQTLVSRLYHINSNKIYAVTVEDGKIVEILQLYPLEDAIS